MRKKKKWNARSLLRRVLKEKNLDTSEIEVYLSDDIELQFDGTVEDMAVTVLPKHYHDLKYRSSASEMLNDIGGIEKAEVTFAGVCELIRRQSSGNKVRVSLKKLNNIFFVKDSRGVVGVVCVVRMFDYWEIEIFSIECWLNKGDRVFFR